MISPVSSRKPPTRPFSQFNGKKANAKYPQAKHITAKKTATNILHPMIAIAAITIPASANITMSGVSRGLSTIDRPPAMKMKPAPAQPTIILSQVLMFHLDAGIF